MLPARNDCLCLSMQSVPWQSDVGFFSTLWVAVFLCTRFYSRTMREVDVHNCCRSNSCWCWAFATESRCLPIYLLLQWWVATFHSHHENSDHHSCLNPQLSQSILQTFLAVLLYVMQFTPFRARLRSFIPCLQALHLPSIRGRIYSGLWMLPPSYDCCLTFYYESLIACIISACASAVYFVRNCLLQEACASFFSQNLHFEQPLISIVYQSPYYAHFSLCLNFS